MFPRKDVRSQSSSIPSSIELDNLQDTSPADATSISAIEGESSRAQEAQPLLDRDPDRTLEIHRYQKRTNSPAFSSENSGWMAAVMGEKSDSKVSRLLNKVAVTSEPGLTNAQLMLTNFDLKPGSY